MIIASDSVAKFLKQSFANILAKERSKERESFKQRIFLMAK